VSRQGLISLGLVIALVSGIVGAIGTALWTLRFGLLAERPPLPAWHTVLRIIIVLTAAYLTVTRRDRLERMALVPRVLEARGLDVTPAMIVRLRRAGDDTSAEILELINLARGFLIQHGKPARTPPPTEGSGRHNGWQRTDLRRSHMAHAIARREPTFRGMLRDVLRCPCCLM
jgi:MFS family permease